MAKSSLSWSGSDHTRSAIGPSWGISNKFIVWEFSNQKTILMADEPLNRSITLIWSMEWIEGESPRYGKRTSRVSFQFFPVAYEVHWEAHANANRKEMFNEDYLFRIKDSHLHVRRISDHQWQQTVLGSRTYRWSTSRHVVSHTFSCIPCKSRTTE